MIGIDLAEDKQALADDFADTAEAMRWYRGLLPSLPEELSGWLGLITIPPAPPFPEELRGRKACAIIWCYTGPHDRADEVLAPVRSFGSPLLVGLQPMPFTVLQSAFDALYPTGLQWYWKAGFFTEISDTAIDVHLKYGAQLPTGHSTMRLYPIDGAASRVPQDATAFAYRDGGWAGVIVGVDPDPASVGPMSQWARDYWEALHPTSAGGGYINFMMSGGRTGSGPPTAATTTGWPGSRPATTPTTPSTSTRTSSPPAGRRQRLAGPGAPGAGRAPPGLRPPRPCAPLRPRSPSAWAGTGSGEQSVHNYLICMPQLIDSNKVASRADRRFRRAP